MTDQTPETPALDCAEARQLTDRIKATAEDLWELVKRAYLGRAWIALDYQSWDAYCITEFGASRLRIPREERPELVTSLREAGLSNRAIAAAVGVSESTVRNDAAAGAQNCAPDDDEVDEMPWLPRQPDAVTIGRDGKSYVRFNVPPPRVEKHDVRINVLPQPEPETVRIRVEHKPRPQPDAQEERRMAVFRYVTAIRRFNEGYAYAAHVWADPDSPFIAAVLAELGEVDRARLNEIQAEIGA